MEHHEVKLFCREDSFFFKFKMNVTFFSYLKTSEMKIFLFESKKRFALAFHLWNVFWCWKFFFTKKWEFFSNRFRGKSVKDEERRKLGFHFQVKRGISMLKLRAEIFVIFHPWQNSPTITFFGNFHWKHYRITISKICLPSFFQNVLTLLKWYRSGTIRRHIFCVVYYMLK